MKNSEETEGEQTSFKKSTLVGFNLVVLVVFLLLVGGIYYWVSKKSKGEVVFPAGINYLSPNTAPTTQATTLDYTKLAASSPWLTFKGKIYKFTFQYPNGMTPLSFPNDTNESVTFKISNTPPELSLMFLVETISSRDKTLVGNSEGFARNYWKFFSGLKGLNSFSDFKNEKGLQGYKVTYTTRANTVTTDNYFFIIPGDSDHLLHMADIFPAEGKVVFDRILNSLDYTK